MEPTEKDIVIKKILELPPEQVSKVLVFIDALESVGGGREGSERFSLNKTDVNRFT